MEDHDKVISIAIRANRINQAATKRGKELKDRGKPWLKETNTKNGKLDKYVTRYEDIHIKKNLTISNPNKNLVLHSLANHSFISSLLTPQMH
jgi:hypothetical protein